MTTATELRDQLAARVAEDDDFRTRFLEDPKAVISAETGIAIPENFNVVVHEDSSDTFHVVLPPTNELTETELAVAAGGLSVNGLWGPGS